MRKSILSALRAVLLERSPLSALSAAVIERTGALNTWGSNAIEGCPLSREDVESILLHDRTPPGRSVRDVLVTVQHEAAFRGLAELAQDPITSTTAQKLHMDVFRGVIPDAGTYRHGTVLISGSVHRPPAPEWVPPMMGDWEMELADRELEEEDPMAGAAWMHHRFETVHPFSDGNGRVGRLLMNLHLLRHNWPPVHVLPGDRERYMDAMDLGHAGDLAPIEELLRELMGRSLLLLLDSVGTSVDALVPVGELAREGPYAAKYLALRASQGELPAVKERGAWRTSIRAVRLYHELVGRG
jgi:Fic family protein